eukprot:12209949-Alexandrium_andersonii.AAC.1
MLLEPHELTHRDWCRKSGKLAQGKIRARFSSLATSQPELESVDSSAARRARTRTGARLQSNYSKGRAI